MSTILIISPEQWDGQFVSKHHYAIELARMGHSVLFYGPPALGGSIEVERIVHFGTSLSIVRSPRVFPALRRLPKALRNWLEKRWLERLETLIDTSIDVIWLFENSRFYDLNFAGERLRIYQQVDLNQSFHPDVAAQTADLTIALSKPIADRIKPFAKEFLQITHGFALTDQQAATNLAAHFDPEKKHAMLIGNLDIPYLDTELLAKLVNARQDVDFHFVGSYSPDRSLSRSLGTAQNVRFWGRQPSEDIPTWLGKADILLVCYLAEEHLEQLANPHKMLEYLAAGKTVLATKTLEYEDKPELVVTAHSQHEFIAKFSEIIENLQDWNSAERAQIRTSYARENSYQNQINRIAQALGERGTAISKSD